MKKNVGIITCMIISYWKVFRIIFVIFSLYLMGDAFYRWDGFEYYASFAEFLPSLSLVSIFWSILAVVTAFLVWLPLRVISFFCLLFKWENAQRFFYFIYLMISLATITFFIKRFVWLGTPLPLYIKLVILFGVALAAVLINWLLQNKYDVIQDRITPLVWIFGIFVIISVPIVGYNTIFKETNGKIAPEHIMSSGAKTDRPNIILITFDAMTTRDMSTYGYHRPTTPFITKWAQKANLFSGLKASGNWTAPTISSLVTGKRVWTHRVFQPNGFDIDKGDTENLPKLLKQNGYYNMAYLSNLIVPFSKNKIDNYFDIFHKPIMFRHELNINGLIELNLYKLFGDNFSIPDWIIRHDFVFGKLLDYMSVNVLKENRGRFYYSMVKMFDTIIHDIANNPPEPFFAWMHIWQPHSPYLPPAPYEGMFGPLTDDYYSRDRYDELIRYCDEEFKEFINEPAIKEKLKKTVIIVSADHGEIFEHGYLLHGGPHLYEQVTSIPLIIKEIGKEDGHVIEDLVEQIDIPVTILDFANIPVPSWMEGRSLMPILRGKKLAAKPTFSMNFEQSPTETRITKGVIAVWEDDLKLIHNLLTKESMLFDLEQDPGELNNIFNKEPEASQRMLKIIYDNLKKANKID